MGTGKSNPPTAIPHGDDDRIVPTDDAGKLSAKRRDPENLSRQDAIMAFRA
jgi:hypothetical protein